MYGVYVCIGLYRAVAVAVAVAATVAVAVAATVAAAAASVDTQSFSLFTYPFLMETLPVLVSERFLAFIY